MGYTQFSKQKVQELIDSYNVKSVMDFGSQNDYGQPALPAPYISEWYKEKDISYQCIDLCGENNSLLIDLAYPIKENLGEFDMVVDCGTIEHVSIDNNFVWEAIYNAWKTKYDLTKVGGVIYSENPKTGNWPGHGRNYHTMQFYKQMSELIDCELLDLGEHPACGNVTDGWNIFASIQKKSNRFPSLEEFKNLDIRQL